MNVDITLPDGSVRNYESPVTGYQIAESIGPRLLKDAICVEIDNNYEETEYYTNGIDAMKVTLIHEYFQKLFFRHQNPNQLNKNLMEFELEAISH